MNHDLFFQAANTGALGRDRVPEVWSVSQVNALARRLLEGSLPLIRVAGEVSGFKRYAAGHCFFTLKDKGAQLSCVMWREAARALPAEPPEGMAVHALGYLSIYERAGRFQFIVRELSAKGEGLWRIAFERLRAKFEAEGLLDPARKRPIPSHPVCLAVITSLEGAAIRDILSIVRRRAPWTDVLVYPARVQGDEAPGSLIEALRQAARPAHADVLIVGRGGGSLEDLRAFNDERLVRAIAASPVPVISAVGHETDVTLADLVADVRAATPSAAAAIAVPDRTRLRADLVRAGEALAASLRGSVVRGRRRVVRLEERLLETVRGGIARRKLAVETLRRRLRALGPMEVLQRGYSLALDGEGKVLRGVSGFRPGSEFTLRLKDGRVHARTESVSEEG
ncbi:MAG: exodeoxyribonuclease VII large subunit [Gemmatimonadales bacterium]